MLLNFLKTNVNICVYSHIYHNFYFFLAFLACDIICYENLVHPTTSS